MSSDDSGHWRVAALAISLLIHGGVAWWAFGKDRPVEKKSAPAELVWVEVPAAPKPVEPEAVPPPPPAEPKPAVLPERPRGVQSPPKVKPASVQPEPALPPAAVPVEPDAVPSDTPFDVPRRDDAPRAMPSLAFALTLDAGVLPEEVVPRGIRAPEISKDILGDAARAQIGRGKVARGLVHPYYPKLGKTLLKQWDADRAVSKNGLKAFSDQFVENSKAWNNIWQSRAEQFAKTGSPIDAEQLSGGRPRPITGAPTGGTLEMQARKDLQKAMSEQFKSTRRAEIRVVQRRDGSLEKVELVKPSNDAFVDQQAVLDVRAAAEKLPPPPDEVIGQREQLISLWEFELIISITPPIPTFTFEFDEALGFVDMRLPLDRRIYKRVKLISVD